MSSYLWISPKSINITGGDWKKLVKGKTGIIYFKDYWLRATDREHPTGDHIDLWNGSRFPYPDFVHGFAFFLRFNEIYECDSLDLSYIHPDLSFSDLSMSNKIFFWEIK